MYMTTTQNLTNLATSYRASEGKAADIDAAVDFATSYFTRVAPMRSFVAAYRAVVAAETPERQVTVPDPDGRLAATLARVRSGDIATTPVDEATTAAWYAADCPPVLKVTP